MSNQAASTRGGPSSRRSPPRKAEDRDAIVTHQTRPGGLGLPPLVLASVTRGRGRGGRGIVGGRDMGYRGGMGRGAGSGRGGPPPSRGMPMPKVTGSNTLPLPSGQSPDIRWVRPPPATASAAATSDSPYLARYGSRPIDRYIPDRQSSPDHQRWDSPPSTAPQPEPRQVSAGPSNYAARPPPPPRIPSSGPSTQRAVPTGPRSTLAIPEPAPAPTPSTSTVDPPSQIVPMKFKPTTNAPKAKNKIPAPIQSLAGEKEEHGDDEESAMNGPVVPSRSEPPAPTMDEKEDIEMEEDIKPDITIIESQTTSGRQDRNTIVDDRNDGVLAWSPHELPECFPPNKPPGRTKSRQAWRSEKEAELKAKGIKVVRALWRDDGVGIHWERLAQPRAKKTKLAPSGNVVGSVSPEDPTPSTSTRALEVRPETPSISKTSITQFPVSPATPTAPISIIDDDEIVVVAGPSRPTASATTLPLLSRPAPTPSSTTVSGASRTIPTATTITTETSSVVPTPSTSTPTAVMPAAAKPPAGALSSPSKSTFMSTTTPNTVSSQSASSPATEIKRSTPHNDQHGPFKGKTKEERKAVTQAWEESRRKRQQEEAEEAIANGLEPPKKKQKKSKGERKKEKARKELAATEEAEATLKAAKAAKASETTAPSKAPPVSTRAAITPFNATPLLPPIIQTSSSSSSSIDPPVPKRIVPLVTDTPRPAVAVAARPPSTGPSVARPTPIRPPPTVTVDGKITGAIGTAPARPPASTSSAVRPAPVRPYGTGITPRPPPTGSARPPSTSSTAAKPFANPSTSIPNPIRPIQSASGSLMNPIRPYTPPTTKPIPAPNNQTRPPSIRPQAPPIRPLAQSSSSSSSSSTTQMPSMRPPHSLAGAPRPTLPIRPNMSRSVTPSNPSARYNELKESLRTKMEEMDNWTSMLTDMPDNIEPIERQIVRTRKECFDLQKQMREERERTGVNQNQSKT